MKTYKETKSEIKKLVIANGLDNITGYDIVALLNDGHNGTNIQNAIDFFRFSPKASKYR
jgi:hypothetical protein